MSLMTRWGAFDPEGPVAESMADLWWLMLALGVVVFIVFAVLLWVGLRRPAFAADEEPRVRHRAGRWFVVWGVVLPAIIIIGVFVATVAAMRAIPESAPSDALEVEIVGHQWWYEVHYPQHGITLEDEMHIPVGRPVSLRLTSADVIHAFWVPALGGKRDLIPEDVTTMVLQADEPGRHQAHCAEFCGLEHAAMQLLVVAEPAEDFDAWIAQQDVVLR